MAQQTSYLGATILDIMGADKDSNFKNGLDTMLGLNPSSNMNLIDTKFISHNSRIVSLENNIEKYTPITTVDLVWQSTISTVDFYSGYNSELTELEDDGLYVFYFDKTNTGSVTFQINSFTTYALRKLLPDGSFTIMQLEDIKKGIPYLVQFKNSQMILVGENYVQNIKDIENQLNEHIEDTDIHTSADDKSKLESIITDSDGNSFLTNDGTYKAPSEMISAILMAEDWVEDSINGWWTQEISHTENCIGKKADISFPMNELLQIIDDGVSIVAVTDDDNTLIIYVFNNIPSINLTASIEIRMVNT